MTDQDFDRTLDDVGNVLALEHVNLRVPDQGLAALFYVTTLGGTRDPYMDFGLANMWVNFGQQQFHLPTGEPQRFDGEIRLVVPDLGDLCRRLERAASSFTGTHFDWDTEGGAVRVTCPWGNRYRCEGPEVTPGMGRGIASLDMRVTAGASGGIARFYQQIMGAPARAHGGVASIAIGLDQCLRFTETQAARRAYDGHHIAIYIASFSAPYRWLRERGLITEESGPNQYRFQSLPDPDTGDVLAELEHEVRSLRHPMYGRVLVNRNPARHMREFRRGEEPST
jgi:hypothetical protein